MKRNYYYLVASLPEIVLDSGKSTVAVSDFVSEIREQIHDKDVALLDFLCYEYDNNNLLSILEKTGKKHDSRGVFSEEELLKEIKNFEKLPSYAQTFVEAFNEGSPIFADLSWENQLTRLFYRSVVSSAPNLFIREWFNFDLNLRNLVVGLNARDHHDSSDGVNSPFKLNRSIINVNDFSESILKSNAPDFGLSGEFEWVERVVSLDRTNLVEFDKAVDLVKWDILDEMTTFSYFQIETILSFIIKLGIVERWQNLNYESGKEMFNKLVDELTSTFEMQDI